MSALADSIADPERMRRVAEYVEKHHVEVGRKTLLQLDGREDGPERARALVSWRGR